MTNTGLVSRYTFKRWFMNLLTAHNVHSCKKQNKKTGTTLLTLGWRRRRRDWFCCCQDCEMASGGVRGVSTSYWKKLVKAWCWRHGAPVSANHSHLPAEMRCDEMSGSFMPFYKHLCNPFSKKNGGVCVKKVSSNFVNDKIVIVILIGLWLSQAGSTDTISWMIKCIYFSTCTHSY